MRVLGVDNRINFTRKPRKEEEGELRAACNKAFNAIGVTDRVIITHGSCFPENEQDSYIGSPYGEKAKDWTDFLMLYGFNGNQLGPVGELQKNSISPYNSSAFAKNRLFIDLKELTQDEYGNILSKDTFNTITYTPENNGKTYASTNFEVAETTYDIALKESFDNFKTQLAAGDNNVTKLNKEFSQFLKHNNKKLTEEGIFNVLADDYGTENIDEWDNELDQNLLPEIRKGNILAIERFKELNYIHKQEIQLHKFEQFIATKQIKENKEWRDKKNFKYFSDLLVGCSQMDKWRYKEAFLEDWEMGARENNARSQRWHIPVIDPKKIFLNDKYELNIGGKFLKEKIDTALEFNENVRIDHAMGLIEPYILSKHAPLEDFSPNEHKNHDVEKYISQLQDEYGEEYDKYWDYPKLLTKLIIPALEEHGLTQDMPVWEDICSYPQRFKEIYDNQLHLPKIINLDWERSEKALQNNRQGDWYLIGSHDNVPAMTYLDRISTQPNGSQIKYTRTTPPWNTLYLTGYLNMDNSRQNINEIRRLMAEKLDSDDKEIVRAKFAELMTTPKFQISFADLLGITDTVYNIGGSNRKENWKERIPKNYLENYYKNLSSEDPTALNIPEILKIALQAKIDMTVVRSANSDQTREYLHNKYQPLLNTLQRYSDILKEEEPINN